MAQGTRTRRWSIGKDLPTGVTIESPVLQGGSLLLLKQNGRPHLFFWDGTSQKPVNLETTSLGSWTARLPNGGLVYHCQADGFGREAIVLRSPDLRHQVSLEYHPCQPESLLSLQESRECPLALAC